MASSTPPHCSITATKPYQNHPYPPQAQNHLKNPRPNHPGKVSLSKPPLPTRNAAAPAAAAQGPSFSSLTRLRPPKPNLGTDFNGRRSTRFVSKVHLGRPTSTSGSRRTSVAEEALHQAIQCGKNDSALENVLINFEHKLCGANDYTFLLRELGNRGEYMKAIRCFEFAVRRERRKNEQGKLASSMISILGRLGKVDLARDVFDTAVSEGYGNTVYAFSALISAYGRSGYVDEATHIFYSMRNCGLKPNLVTYNAVIDAFGKGGLDFNRVGEIFEEMMKNGVQPDRITYNSLLAVCSRGGLWETAKGLFGEMVERGIDQDIFTYNTLLDAICKGGQMDLASEIMSQMPLKNILPNVVTYSTMIDGYAKGGRYENALNLFNEMRYLGIGLDRVCFNSLLSIYTKLGQFEEALDVCKEMEDCGIKRDVVTYNALLCGYGKQGKYNEVRRLFNEMKIDRVSPNLLTYSTIIDVYSKGGLYGEAMEIFREFKKSGLKADVVLYSALIDALCKNGLVESAVSLLDEMTKEGIKPNVVTYNSIIDAFGRPVATESTTLSAAAGDNMQNGFSCPVVISKGQQTGGDDNCIIKILGQLASEKKNQTKKDGWRSQEISCLLGVFLKMHELKIKPNVVTFSAILNACSRCDSFEEASMLLEELRLFDNQVYGVTHGLLMGNREHIWCQAQTLFEEVRQMDTSTASAFYNALTDMLWHFGQKRGAELVVLDGKRRHVWENVWSDSCLDLHLMSSGAARAMVHAWLLNIRSIVYEGHELPKLLSILTGWGKHSKVVGDGALKRTVESLLVGMGAPFRLAKCNLGRFVSPGSMVSAWLRESGTLEVLVLQDDRNSTNNKTTSSSLHEMSKLELLPL